MSDEFAEKRDQPFGVAENHITALIRINPTIGDDIVTSLREQGLKALEFARARVIANDGDVKLATDDLSILSKLKKGLEEKRKEYLDPINAHANTIRDQFKAITGPIEEADVVTRAKILDYRHTQEEKARQIEEANRLRMEAARLEAQASGTGEISESVKVLDVPPEQPKTIHADTGSAGVRKDWKFEVTDFGQLPEEYKMVDSAKLGKVVRAGLHSIPGVRIWSEDALTVRPR